MFNFSDIDLQFGRIIAHSNTSKCIADVQSLRQRIGDDGLLAMSRRNDVTSIMAHALFQIEDPNLPESWRVAHVAVQERISGYLSELGQVAESLAAEDIMVVALKNSGIACGIYSCPGCCPMGDVDVLVEKQNFGKAHEVLIEQGYDFEVRGLRKGAVLEDAEKSGGSEYCKVLSNGERLWLELQWRPVAGRWLRPEQEPTALELMTRSVAIPGSAVRLMSPEDNLLQVALHTAKHTYVRPPGFRLHLDVLRIVQAYPGLDWQLFVRRVLRLQVKTPVYYSLYIPKVLFDAPVPKWVLCQFRPPFWKEFILSKWLQRVGLFDPEEKKFSKPGYILFSALLCDDLKGLLRAIFPNRSFMQEQFGSTGRGSTLFAYLRRIINLTLTRSIRGK